MNYFILMNSGVVNILYLIFSFTGTMFIVSGLKLLLKNIFIMHKELHPEWEATGALRFFIIFINSIFGHILVAVLAIVMIVALMDSFMKSDEPRSEAPDDPLSESIEEFRGDDLLYQGQSYYESSRCTDYEYLLNRGYETNYPLLIADAFNECDGIDKTANISITVWGYIDHGAFGNVFRLNNYTDDEVYDHIVSIYTGDTEMLYYDDINDLSADLPIEGIIQYRGSYDTLVNTMDSGTDILSSWPELSYVKIDSMRSSPSLELTDDTAVIYAQSFHTNIEIPDVSEITVIGSKGTVVYKGDEFDYARRSGDHSPFTFTVSQNGILDLISEAGELYAVRVTDSNGETYDLGYIPDDLEY